jgi:glycerol-3-phosphate cytidylyltransferase-like family protein
VRLVVGVVGDAEVASYKRLPVLTLAERVAVIEACRLVDEVVAGCPVPVTEELLRGHGIDVVVHGDDLDPDALERWYGVPMRLGRFETVPYSHGPGPEALSTSAVIKRIRRRGA